MRCSKCEKNEPFRYHERHLADGRVIIIKGKVSICEHRPPTEKKFLADRLTEWANRLCILYPERVIVLRECSCDCKKDRHHPSYKEPFVVELLCRKCHKAEHRRLRALAAQSAHNSTTPAGQSVAQNSLGIASSTVDLPSITTSQAGELRSASNLIAV